MWILFFLLFATDWYTIIRRLQPLGLPDLHYILSIKNINLVDLRYNPLNFKLVCLHSPEGMQTFILQKYIDAGHENTLMSLEGDWTMSKSTEKARWRNSFSNRNESHQSTSEINCNIVDWIRLAHKPYVQVCQ